MASKADRDREWRKAQAKLLALLAEGEDDPTIQAALGFGPDRYWRCKKAAFEAEAERLRSTPTEHTYVQYCLNQAACIKDLTDLLKDSKEKNASASVGAIRARSDIFDKLIKVGQEFGILEKKPEEKRIVAGVVVAQLSNDQLRQAITSEISRLNVLVSTYGELPMADMMEGELYYDSPEPATSKTNKAKANKVHGGRRRLVE